MKRLNVLVIGSGGREHALCSKIKASPLCAALYCAPGNAGIANVATRINLADAAATLAFCKEKSIDLVVIGPEQPLVDGLADVLKNAGIATFGPSKAAAQLEGSKDFTKALCDKYKIPTAVYRTFTEAAPAITYAKTQSYPLVIKADGLAAGKGVVIAENYEQAEAAITSMFAGAFGDAGKKVVIEEFLQGTELSFFAISDGVTVREFASAQDHKRAFDGDQGPNTGGMGTYSPSPFATEAVRKRVMEEIVIPSIDGMKAEGTPFTGVLFAGLMLTPTGPKLIEYNTRFGDPETQVMLLRLTSDLLQLLYFAAIGRLAEAQISFTPDAAVCVVMAAKGYPGDYAKGTEIKNLDATSTISRTTVFHAGTEVMDGKIVANGGRVLGVCATGQTLKEAQISAYKAVDVIDWPEGFCRRDIGSSGL